MIHTRKTTRVATMAIALAVLIALTGAAKGCSSSSGSPTKGAPDPSKLCGIEEHRAPALARNNQGHRIVYGSVIVACNPGLSSHTLSVWLIYRKNEHYPWQRRGDKATFGGIPAVKRHRPPGRHGLRGGGVGVGRRVDLDGAGRPQRHVLPARQQARRATAVHGDQVLVP